MDVAEMISVAERLGVAVLCLLILAAGVWKTLKFVGFKFFDKDEGLAVLWVRGQMAMMESATASLEKQSASLEKQGVAIEVIGKQVTDSLDRDKESREKLNHIHEDVKHVRSHIDKWRPQS